MTDIKALIANVRTGLDELEAAVGGGMGEMETEAPETEGEEMPMEGEGEVDPMAEKMGMRPKKAASMEDYFAKKGKM